MPEQGMIRQEIARLVSEAAQEARESGGLPSVALPEIEIERPQRPDHGDYASSLALRLARAAGAKPLDLAQEIARHIRPHEAVGDVSVAAPGFINFRLSEAWLARQVDEIRAAGDDFGVAAAGRRQDLPGRIRERQPDRAPARRQWALGRHGQHAGERAQRRRLPRAARVLCQRHADAGRDVRADALRPLPAAIRRARRNTSRWLPRRIRRRAGGGDTRPARRPLPRAARVRAGSAAGVPHDRHQQDA